MVTQIWRRCCISRQWLETLNLQLEVLGHKSGIQYGLAYIPPTKLNAFLTWLSDFLHPQSVLDINGILSYPFPGTYTAAGEGWSIVVDVQQ